MPTDSQHGCPCEAVRDLKVIVERHEAQLNDGNVKFAIIDQKLENILAKLDKKEKFNSSIVTSVVNAMLGIIIAWMAVKLGLQ